MDVLNNKALIALNNCEFHDAQKMLRLNVKRSKSHLAYNNLGYFYSDNGMELKNGKCVRAGRIGMRYLLKANEIKHTYKNSMAIGIMARYDRDYMLMEKAFKQAAMIKENYLSYYNLGVTYILLNNDEDAFVTFEKALNFSVNADEKYISTLALLNCSLNNKKLDFDKFSYILKYEGEEKSIEDEIAILYNYGLNWVIGENYSEIIREEYLELPVLSMMVDSLIYEKKRVELESLLKDLEHIYTDEEMSNIHLIIENSTVRRRTIVSYKYEYGIDDRLCCYIECPIHIQ